MSRPDRGPRRPPGVRRLLRIFIGREGTAGEVDRELEAHLRLKEDELIGTGMEPTEAAREARRAFGDRVAIATECTDVRHADVSSRQRTEWWQGLGQDVRVSLRGLRHSPGFTTVAVLTLALGVGANVAMFSAIDAIIGRALPYGDPDGLVAPTLQENVSVSKQRLEAIRPRMRSLDGLAAYSRWGVTLTGEGQAAQLEGAVVTADMFRVLGVSAALGRTFVAGEDRPGRSDVVILGHGLWTQRFAGDSAIVGRSIELNGRPTTVVGVMPPGFAFPTAGARIWMPTPIAADSTDDYVAGYLLMVGRLPDGVTRDAALDDLKRAIRELGGEGVAGFEPGDDTKASMPPLRDVLVGSVGRALLLLLGAVAFVLLIACVNVANLLIARGNAHAREFAIRAALGAGRGRLVRQLVTESLLLAVAGGLVGLLIARALVGLFATSIPTNSPGLPTLAIDGRVLLFALGLSILVGLVFGVVPALRVSGDPGDVLREGSRGGTGGAKRQRLMRGLVVAEVALALVLAVGAGLMLQSFWRLRNESPGFRTDGILSLSVAASEARYDTPERQAALFGSLFDRLRAIPGVLDVGAIHLLPLGSGNWNPSLVIEGRPLADDAPPREVDWRLATPGYFSTVGVPLLGGRLFDGRDALGTPTVALVNRALADSYFPGEDPIGERVRTFFEGRDNPATIIGVVGNTKDQTLAGDPRPQIYRPFAQRPLSWMSILLRTRGDPMAVAGAVRAAVGELDPDIPVAELRPMSDVVAESIAEPRLLFWLLGMFGVLAIALGVIGIYGVMSYVVSRRMPEIGVRLALGARPGDVRRLVLGEAMRMTGLGLALGALGAEALTTLLDSQLYEVGARDPLSLAGAAALLAAVALAAAWIPAARAARAEPTRSLRTA